MTGWTAPQEGDDWVRLRQWLIDSVIRGRAWWNLPETGETIRWLLDSGMIQAVLRDPGGELEELIWMEGMDMPQPPAEAGESFFTLCAYEGAGVREIRGMYEPDARARLEGSKNNYTTVAVFLASTDPVRLKPHPGFPDPVVGQRVVWKS